MKESRRRIGCHNLLAMLAVVPVLSGCGDDSTGPQDALGSFTATVSGGISAVVSGAARYQIMTFAPGSHYGYLHSLNFTLTDFTPGSVMLSPLTGLDICEQHAFPLSGSLPLAGYWNAPGSSDEARFFFELWLPDGSELVMDEWSGTVSFRGGTGDRVTGSIHGQGSGSWETETDQQPITLTFVAEFDAVLVQGGTLPNLFFCPGALPPR